jgi:HYR domain
LLLSSRSLLKGLAVTSAAVIVAAGGASAALADDISNNLDLSVDPAAEIMSLNVGGVSGTTHLYVVERNSDGKPGCNISGPNDPSLTVAVISSDPSVATVSPSSITFGSCGDSKLVTVTPVKVGSTTVSLTQTSNTTPGSFNLASARFTVNVSAPAPSNTAPQVAVIGVSGGTSYEKGSVPSAVCSVTDTEDGASTFAATLSAISGTLAEYGLGNQTASCSYTDAGSLTASSSVTYSIVDTAEPSLSLPADKTVEATGPSGAVVSFTATATDAGGPASPSVSCEPPSGSTFELGTTTVTCSTQDAAGNSASGSFTVTVEDTTAPDVTVPDDMTIEATGPSGAVVTFEASATDTVGPLHPAVTCTPASGSTFALGAHTVTCTASDDFDNEGTSSFSVTVQDTTAPAVTVPDDTTIEATGPSGAVVTYGTATAYDLVSGDVSTTCAPASGSTFALGDTEVTCSATDSAGNTGSAKFTVTVEDTTAPVITWVGGPQDGASYVFGSVPDAGTCTAVDLVDGAVSCDVTGYGTGVGAQELTATAADSRGNRASSNRTYTVTAWTLGGFYAPVDMGGIWNTVKGGSTVPLKFEVFAGSTEQTSTSAIASFVARKVSCTGGAEDVVETLATTGATVLRYDSTGGQFIQNWQTPKAAGTCYRATMTTQDGSFLSANFKLK